MEIERKFLVMTPPENYESFPCHEIEQAYLCTEPVVRVRKEDDTCYLTYKSKGLLAREEYNLPLTKEAYTHLLTKADGNILTKKRYLIPVPGREDLTVEFDVFEGKFAGLMLAEIEFTSEEDARIPASLLVRPGCNLVRGIPEQQALKNALNCSYFYMTGNFLLHEKGHRRLTEPPMALLIFLKFCSFGDGLHHSAHSACTCRHCRSLFFDVCNNRLCCKKCGSNACCVL